MIFSYPVPGFQGAKARKLAPPSSASHKATCLLRPLPRKYSPYEGSRAQRLWPLRSTSSSCSHGHLSSVTYAFSLGMTRPSPRSHLPPSQAYCQPCLVASHLGGPASWISQALARASSRQVHAGAGWGTIPSGSPSQQKWKIHTGSQRMYVFRLPLHCLMQGWSTKLAGSLKDLTGGGCAPRTPRMSSQSQGISQLKTQALSLCSVGAALPRRLLPHHCGTH